MTETCKDLIMSTNSGRKM